MTLNYNISRSKAAFLLGISTRTLDRYIRKWVLSYTKKSNRVLLSEEEVLALKKRIDEGTIEVTMEWEVIKNPQHSVAMEQGEDKEESIDTKLAIKQSLGEFLDILRDKDKQLEEKNKVIFMLNRQIWELESKLSNMIALPDYTKEKEEILKEKERIELEKKQLEDNVVYLKIVNILFLFFIIFLVVAGVIWLKGGMN